MQADLKKHLWNFCKEYADRRLATAQQTMAHALAAVISEDKVSMGDKYETGRAMMQIEYAQSMVQKQEAIKLMEILDHISSQGASKRILAGSLVVTNDFHIYLAISIGKITLEGKEYLIVASDSPLGKNMMGLTVGSAFQFNKRNQVVVSII